MNITKWFKKSEKKVDQDIKNLLRENLGLIRVDIFYADDPLVGMTEEERKLYLKKFYEISQDKEVMERIKWLINKQARLLLGDMKDEQAAAAGANTINGLGVWKDDLERLGSIYLKESIPPPAFDKYSVI